MTRTLLAYLLLGWGLAYLGCTKPPSGDIGDAIPRPALDHIADQRLVRAIENSQTAVEEALSSAPAWGQLGHIYFIHGWKAEGSACYQRASEIEPEAYRWHYFLGRSYLQVDPAKAVAALEKSLQLNPNYAPSHLHCAQALRDLGRFEAARHHLMQAAKIDPRHGAAELGLGQLELAAGRFNKARQHLERALELVPQKKEIHTALSQVHMAAGDREAARQHARLADQSDELAPIPDPLFEEAERSATAAEYWLYKRAKKAMLAGNFPKAVADFAQADLEKANDPMLWCGYGAALLGAGRHAEAVEILERARATIPTGSTGAIAPENLQTIYTNLGYAYAVTGKAAAAESTLREALDLDPTAGDAAINLALLYQQGGRLDEALAVLQTSSQLKNNIKVQSLLDTLLRQQRGRNHR